MKLCYMHDQAAYEQSFGTSTIVNIVDLAAVSDT